MVIEYTSHGWAVGLAFQHKGSVLHKGFAWAAPAAILSVILHIYSENYTDWNREKSTLSEIVTGYAFVLGFLLVFRTQIAYTRFWEGASYLQTIRGGWFNVVSCCFAFCTPKAEKQQEVQQFQHHLVRLMSMLYGTALQEVAQLEEATFEVLDFECMDAKSILWMQQRTEKCEVILQWIQRLIVDNHHSGVVSIAPPILSRVFQELGNGIIDLSNARRIKMIPFPFPYAQVMSIMLMIHWFFQILVSGLTMASPFSAAALSFITTLAFWSINYIAMEIEMPYGDDPNDLPLANMQTCMNKSLLTLLHRTAQVPPKLILEKLTTNPDAISKRAWRSDRPNDELLDYSASPDVSISMVAPDMPKDTPAPLPVEAPAPVPVALPPAPVKVIEEKASRESTATTIAEDLKIGSGKLMKDSLEEQVDGMLKRLEAIAGNIVAGLEKLAEQGKGHNVQMQEALIHCRRLPDMSQQLDQRLQALKDASDSQADVELAVSNLPGGRCLPLCQHSWRPLCDGGGTVFSRV